MSILFSAILLFVSIFIAWAGGSFFIQGVDGARRLFRFSGLTAGLLIASISTSSPELFVGVSSALQGIPEVSLGDVLGSNVVNIALIFGIFLACSPRHLSEKHIRIKDIVISSLAPLTILLLAFDGVLSKLDGVILLMLFALWLRWLMKGEQDETEEGERRKGTLLHFAIGLGMLIVAGYAFTQSASNLAQLLGVNLFFFSAIVVALGTSMPELATSIIALRTKQSAVAVGNLLGSNVFNSLGILGLVCLIQPITVSATQIAIPVFFAIIATLVASLSARYSSRMIGTVLIGAYLLYVSATAFGG
jgi:cation:H+ antiporter